jgi:hypothetical protein
VNHPPYLSFAKNTVRSGSSRSFGLVRPQSPVVITLLLHVLRLLPFLVGGHQQLALENLTLRQQLAVYKRTVPRPKLRPTDRLFWAGLARFSTCWREALVIVSPDTVLRWQRRRFRAYWTKLSRRSTVGRPSRRRGDRCPRQEDGHGESLVGRTPYPR